MMLQSCLIEDCVKLLNTEMCVNLMLWWHLVHSICSQKTRTKRQQQLRVEISKAVPALYLCFSASGLKTTFFQHALSHKVRRHHRHKPSAHHFLHGIVHQAKLQHSCGSLEVDKFAACDFGSCVKVYAVQLLP